MINFNHNPWTSPDKDTGMGSLSLLQWIFPTQGSKPGLLHYRQILCRLSGPPGKIIRGKASFNFNYVFVFDQMYRT